MRASLEKMADPKNEEVMEVDEVITILDDEDMAESKKDEGNKLYKLKKYSQALPLYTEAIQLEPENASYYGNRSACYLMLNKYKEAFEDARRSVTLDPSFTKGYIRMAKCYIVFGDLTAANNTLLKAKELDPGNEAITTEMKKLETIVKFKVDADKAYEKKEYRRVIYCMDQVLRLGVNSPIYKVRKAECLAYLSKYQEAQDIAVDILHADNQNVDALYVKGLCLYYGEAADNTDRAFTHFQYALKLAPDHRKLLEIYKKAKLLKQKKEEGNDAFKASRFKEAYDIYTEALNVDPINNSVNAKLYFNRATVLSKLRKLKEAVDDCSTALKLDEKYLKALMRRAWCYMQLGEYEEAVRDYTRVCKMERTRENENLLHEARIELKKSKWKDYYKILGITKSATIDEIKKAYRKRALVHHPDRHATSSETERLEQEKRFKEVGEAYGILSDPKKRARYDNGEDLESMEEMTYFTDIDPTRLFRFRCPFFGDGCSYPFYGNFPGAEFGDSCL